jgi:ferric-dicitrate binding protein FerR (iron transport regulator)
MSTQRFQGWTTADEYAAEQERLWQKREWAMAEHERREAEQDRRDAQRRRGLGMLRFFFYICLGAGLVLVPLYWFLSAILGDW